MGAGFSACHLEYPQEILQGAPPTPSSSRGSQLLCEYSSGRLVCSGVGNEVIIYGTASGRKTRSLEGHVSPVTCLISSGSALWTGSVDKSIRRWDPDSGQTHSVMKGHGGAVWCLAHWGGSLFSGSDDSSIMQWSVESGACLATLQGHVGPVRCLLISDGVLASGSDDAMIMLWDASSGAITARLRGHTGGVTCLLAKDGFLWSGSADGRIIRWDLKAGQPLASFQGHSDAVTCLLDFEGSLFSGSRDKTVMEWAPMTGLRKGTLNVGTIWFRNRRGFLVEAENGTIRLSREANGEKFGKFDNDDGTLTLRSKSGRYLSICEDGTVVARQEEVGIQERLQILDNGDGSVSLQGINGRYISATEDGTVSAKLTPSGDPGDLETFQYFFIEGHYSGVTCLIALEGALLSGSADRSVKLWDPRSGMLLASLEGRTGITCLLDAGGALYAAGARSMPIRLPRPKPLQRDAGMDQK